MGGALANTSHQNPRSLAIEEVMGSHIAKHVSVINSWISIKINRRAVRARVYSVTRRKSFSEASVNLVGGRESANNAGR